MANKWKYKSGYLAEDLNPHLKQGITPIGTSDGSDAANELTDLGKSIRSYSELGGILDPKQYNQAFMGDNPNIPQTLKAAAGGGITLKDAATNQQGYSITRDPTEQATTFQTGGQATAAEGARLGIEGYTDEGFTDQFAEQRSNVWGASDDSSGRSYLEKIAQLDDNWDAGWKQSFDSRNALDEQGFFDMDKVKQQNQQKSNWEKAQIENLYTQGFGREGDIEGMNYHLDKLRSGEQTIQEVAQTLLLSEEAGVRDHFSAGLSRDVDDRGLQYFLSQEGKTDDVSDNAARAIHAMGEDGQFLQTEKQLLQASRDNRGIGGTQGQTIQDLKDTGMYTKAATGGFRDLDWTNVSQGAHNESGYNTGFGMPQRAEGGGIGSAQADKRFGLAKTVADIDAGNLTIAEATNKFKQQGDIMEAYAAANPAGTGISEIPTFAEQDELIASGKTPEQITADLKADPWSLYKQQGEGPSGPTDDGPGGDGPGGDGPGDEGPGDGTDDTPDDTPDLKPTDHSPYEDQKKIFTNTATRIKDNLPQADMSIRNSAYMKAGGSAKGVRLKRSKKFKSGESSLGTKQLGRQLQIKSLNI
tara:strand:- start:350 stop:2104 length:1755 start_codon:yes stop_codon:yes gene_type:complete